VTSGTVATSEPLSGSKKGADRGRRTAYFLRFIDNEHPHFIARLNRKLQESWSEDLFKDLTGEKVSHLWKRYKKYLEGRPCAGPASTAPPAKPSHV
jgi:hypothetical protein